MTQATTSASQICSAGSASRQLTWGGQASLSPATAPREFFLASTPHGERDTSAAEIAHCGQRELKDRAYFVRPFICHCNALQSTRGHGTDTKRLPPTRSSLPLHLIMHIGP